jgi:hypothetical protein
MNVKYLVRPLSESNVCDSIYETWNLIEALKKVEEQYEKNETKCIIVSCPEDITGCQKGASGSFNEKSTLKQ